MVTTLTMDLRCSCGATLSLECPSPNTWERVHQVLEVISKWIDAHKHVHAPKEQKP